MKAEFDFHQNIRTLTPTGNGPSVQLDSRSQTQLQQIVEAFYTFDSSLQEEHLRDLLHCMKANIGTLQQVVANKPQPRTVKREQMGGLESELNELTSSRNMFEEQLLNEKMYMNTRPQVFQPEDQSFQQIVASRGQMKELTAKGGSSPSRTEKPRIKSNPITLAKHTKPWISNIEPSAEVMAAENALAISANKTKKQLPTSVIKANANASILQELQDKIAGHNSAIDILTEQLAEIGVDDIQQYVVKKKIAKEKADIKRLQLQMKNLS